MTVVSKKKCIGCKIPVCPSKDYHVKTMLSGKRNPRVYRSRSGVVESLSAPLRLRGLQILGQLLLLFSKALERELHKFVKIRRAKRVAAPKRAMKYSQR